MSDAATEFKNFAPFLLNPRITPRLRKEIEKAIEAHEQTNSRPQQDLQQQRQQLIKHWDKDHPTMIDYAREQWYLDSFVTTLLGVLTKEYSLENLPIEELPLGECVLKYGNEKQRARAAHNYGWPKSRLTHDTAHLINWGISEFLLDREHVEFRFRTACEGKSLVKRLYQQHETARLAELVAKDEIVLKQVVSWSEDSQELLKVLPLVLKGDVRFDTSSDQSLLAKIRSKFRRTRRPQTNMPLFNSQDWSVIARRIAALDTA